MFQRWLDWFNSATDNAQIRPKNTAALQRAAVPSGMVQLGSLTFRLLRVSPDVYGVVRVIDDCFVGYFEQRPVLAVFPEQGQDRELLRSIACAAIRAGKTQWFPQAAAYSAPPSTRKVTPKPQLQLQLATSRAR